MTERQSPTAAALYARVSSDRQDVHLSVAVEVTSSDCMTTNVSQPDRKGRAA